MRPTDVVTVSIYSPRFLCLERALHCTQSSISIQRPLDDPYERWLCPGKRRRTGPLPYFPTYHTPPVLSPTPTAMSTDQRASDRVGELIHHAFESLLQANKDLERLQDLLGLGMDSRQLLAPHSQMTWKFMAPQEEKFRENWKKFVSAMQDVESSSGQPQPVVAKTVEPASASLPAIIVQAAGEAVPVAQTQVRSFFGWFRAPFIDAPHQNAPNPVPDPASQVPAPPTPASAAPVPVAIKEDVEQAHRIPPSGSVDNPMEIDDSDDEEIIIQGPAATPKRKKTGARTVDNPYQLSLS